MSQVPTIQRTATEAGCRIALTNGAPRSLGSHRQTAIIKRKIPTKRARVHSFSRAESRREYVRCDMRIMLLNAIRPLPMHKPRSPGKIHPAIPKVKTMNQPMNRLFVKEFEAIACAYA